ncbi:MAG: hypothetical protein L0H41_01720 [Microlunatus sp.]|nr:hypothetical protein [Microlunatus sp.]MDN5805332.1 hypothetical protein [Microlunatus sp.]
MAIIYDADLSPGKAELIGTWLDDQPWGGAGDVLMVGAYRFDDPDGEVGIEGHVVRRGDRLLHVPLSYRGAPLDEPAACLIGRMRHSVLGERWVYDATTDPVAIASLARALRGEQDTAAWEIYQGDQLVERRDPTVELYRTTGPNGERVGGVAVALGDGAELRVARVLTEDEPGGQQELRLLWSDGPVVIAGLSAG